MVISIRPANDRDIEALCEMYYDFHEFHVCGVPTHLRSLGDRERWDRSYLRGALGKIIKGDDSEIFVAEVAGKLAGLIEVYVRQDADEATLVRHKYAELQSLMVLVPFRRNGIGVRLVEVARRWMGPGKGSNRNETGSMGVQRGSSGILRDGWFQNSEAEDGRRSTSLSSGCAGTRPGRASRFLLCIGCGECIERCQFGALSLQDQVCVVEYVRCMGCGLCAAACPTGALRLERLSEDEMPVLPLDRREWAEQCLRGRDLAVSASVDG